MSGRSATLLLSDSVVLDSWGFDMLQYPTSGDLDSRYTCFMRSHAVWGAYSPSLILRNLTRFVSVLFRVLASILRSRPIFTTALHLSLGLVAVAHVGFLPFDELLGEVI